MKYKLVIFDLDGTLIDSLQGIAFSTNRLLEKYKYPRHPVEKYKEFIGNGREVLLQKALPTEIVKRDNLDIYLNELIHNYEQFWDYEMGIYQGIPELLLELKNRNIPIAINTNKDKETSHKITERFFPNVNFISVIGGNSLESRKPNPQGALYIAEGANVLPEQCVYIGDSEVDIKTAQNASMDMIAVDWGFRTKEQQQLAGACLFAKDTEDILELLACSTKISLSP